MPIDWLQGQDVNALIHALNRIRRQENGKVSFRTFSFEELAETLSSAVQLPSDVPYEHRKAAVRDAVCQVTASGRLTKDQMINKIRERIEAYLSRPAVDFWIRTSWSANIFTPELKSLSVDNSKLLFAKIPKRFHQDDISESAKRYHDICVPVHYRPILIRVKARCEYSAINSALDASDLMRALVNFILNRKNFRRTCSGPRQPVNLILPGPLHTVHRRDGSLIPPNMYWYNPRHFVVQEKQRRDRDYSRVRESTLRLKNRFQRSFSQELVRRGLLRYTRALDHIDLQSSFSELWSALETVTFNKPRSSSDDTIRRASFFFKDRALARQTLRHLRDQRNAYAHQAAQHENPEILLMQLKGFVEALLLRLIGNPHRLKNEREFEELLDAPDDVREIDRRIRILRCARKTAVSTPIP